MKPTPQPVPAPPADFWKRDEALRRTADLIERSAGRVRAVSFDFFDTLVWRLAARPTDVFFEAGRRLLEAKLLPAAMPAADFEVLRRRGEMKAREHQNRTIRPGKTFRSATFTASSKWWSKTRRRQCGSSTRRNVISAS